MSINKSVSMRITDFGPVSLRFVLVTALFMISLPVLLGYLGWMEYTIPLPEENRSVQMILALENMLTVGIIITTSFFFYSLLNLEGLLEGFMLIVSLILCIGLSYAYFVFASSTDFVLIGDLAINLGTGFGIPIVIHIGTE